MAGYLTPRSMKGWMGKSPHVGATGVGQSFDRLRANGPTAKVPAVDPLRLFRIWVDVRLDPFGYDPPFNDYGCTFRYEDGALQVRPNIAGFWTVDASFSINNGGGSEQLWSAGVDSIVGAGLATGNSVRLTGSQAAALGSHFEGFAGPFGVDPSGWLVWGTGPAEAGTYRVKIQGRLVRKGLT